MVAESLLRDGGQVVVTGRYAECEPARYSPGVVETDLTREVRLTPGARPLSAPEHSRGWEARLAGLRALLPLGRLGPPAARYLPGASWLTGTDGGLLLRE